MESKDCNQHFMAHEQQLSTLSIDRAKMWDVLDRLNPTLENLNVRLQNIEVVMQNFQDNYQTKDMCNSCAKLQEEINRQMRKEIMDVASEQSQMDNKIDYLVLSALGAGVYLLIDLFRTAKGI